MTGACVVTTTVDSAEAAESTARCTSSRTKAHHSYDVPEVVVTPVIGGNDGYLAWVSEETS
jgi:uncharacterized protein involved in tolerance to divalent cations